MPPSLAIGQFVELVTTVPSSQGGSLVSGTRGVVREIDSAREGSLFVAFFAGTSLSGEGAWLRPVDVTPA